MIGISGILGGITIFSTSGAILAMAGPAGVLTTFAAVGLVVIFVMEGLSEMIELWPVSNAMMEFVKSFVDGDLATVVGIAYWYDTLLMSLTQIADVDCYRYSWSSCFAALIIATAEFTGYWHLAQEWQIFILFILCPLLLMVINCSGVKVRALLHVVPDVYAANFIVLWVYRMLWRCFQDNPRYRKHCTFLCSCWERSAVDHFFYPDTFTY